jgi:membrane-bound metal-dependent hydrolase YbcI (DUF457 family)
MFIGHFALGFAAKRWTPRVSLAALFGAAQLADLLWPALVALGIEQVRIDPGNTASTPLDFVSYPYSHSLAALVVWGILFGWLCRRVVPDSRVFGVICALVISHWFLDVLVHRPDLPLYPGGTKFGLGLWNRPRLEKLVEIVMYAGGLWIYLRATRARDRVGSGALFGLAAFLFVGYLLASAPPPSVTALWAAALVLGGLTLVWAWWADTHRVPTKG